MKNSFRRVSVGVTALAISAASLLGAAPASADTAQVCRGTISGTQASSIDILVPEGATCTLKDVQTRYGGSIGRVEVSRNAKLNVVGGNVSYVRTIGEYATVWVTGNSEIGSVDLGYKDWSTGRAVSRGAFAEFVLRDSTAYNVDSPAGHRNIEISSSTLWNLKAKGGRSVKVTNGSKVTGSLDLQYLRGDTTFTGSTAESFKFSLGRPNSRVIVTDSTFTGRNYDYNGLEVRTSHEARLRNNYVAAGSLRAAKNRSTVEISGNTIKDALSCSDNAFKPFAATKNSANEKIGQCSGL